MKEINALTLCNDFGILFRGLFTTVLSHLPRHQKALYSLTCADVPLRNYSLTDQLFVLPGGCACGGQ